MAPPLASYPTIGLEQIYNLPDELRCEIFHRCAASIDKVTEDIHVETCKIDTRIAIDTSTRTKRFMHFNLTTSISEYVRDVIIPNRMTVYLSSADNHDCAWAYALSKNPIKLLMYKDDLLSPVIIDYKGDHYSPNPPYNQAPAPAPRVDIFVYNQTIWLSPPAQERIIRNNMKMLCHKFLLLREACYNYMWHKEIDEFNPSNSSASTPDIDNYDTLDVNQAGPSKRSKH
jgi:hypothetical protein